MKDEEIDAMREEFHRSLNDTTQLFPCFPGGFDFGVDPYDPLITDMVFFVKTEGDIDKTLHTGERARAIIFSAQRHITVHTRYALFRLLEEVIKKCPAKDKAAAALAKSALQDCSIHPLFIGIVEALYERHLLDTALTRCRIEREPLDQHLISLAGGAMDESGEEPLEVLAGRGDEAIRALDTFLFDRQDEPSEVDIDFALRVLLRIPGFHSAYVIFDLMKYYFDLMDYEKLSHDLKASPLREGVILYLLNEVRKNDIDIFDRWRYYEMLSLLGDPRLFAPLRQELMEGEPRRLQPAAEDQEATAAFYEDVAHFLMLLGDRRAVPVFIKVLSGGGAPTIPAEARASIGEMLEEESPWYEEIAQGLKLLKEGETVFVEKGIEPATLIMRDVEKYQQFHQLVTGKAMDITELNKRARCVSDRIHQAYHDDLDGLRPVDLHEPQVNLGFLERMTRDFQASLKGQENMGEQELHEKYRRFQAEWLLTPLEDQGGAIPLVVMMKEQKAAAKSAAQQEHFNKSLAERINTLCLEASDLLEEGRRDAARKRVRAALELEPGNPFAEALQRKTGRGPVKAEKKEEEPSRDIRTDYLKPILSDVLLHHRPGLEEALEKERVSLKERGICGPVIDSVHLRHMEEYITRNLEERAQEESPLSRIDDELEILSRTLELEYFTLLNFTLSGEKVFYLAPRLVERLMDTELNVQGSLLKPPFPSCALVYQDPQFIQLFHRCFADQKIVPEYDTPVTVFITESGCEGSPATLIIVAARVSQDFRYYGLVRRGLHVREDRTIEEALRTDWKELQGGAGDEMAPEDSFFFSDERMTFFRTIINSLLYLSSKDPDITRMSSPVENIRTELKRTRSPAHMKKLRQQLQNKRKETSAHPYILVGKNMGKSKLHPHYLAGDVGTWRTIMKRFMVRGHWKHQACGRELSERKLIWIQPYWKGPEDIAEVIANPYVVE